MSAPRHFLDLDGFSATALNALLDTAADHKAAAQAATTTAHRAKTPRPLEGRILALLFQAQSTRTRISFAAAIGQLGGQGILLPRSELHLDRGETLADTATAISCYVDAVLLRSTEQNFFDQFVAQSQVPVINGLTEHSHPCQVLADLLTLRETFGGGGTMDWQDLRVAWLGPFNNMTRSYLHAAEQLGFALALSLPPELLAQAATADQALLERAQAANPQITLCDSPQEAAQGAQALTTDTWHSLGDDQAAHAKRVALLRPWRVEESLFAQADPQAIFLHCLPAHRDEEVSAAVLDGARSRVWQQASNRLPTQKAILLWTMGALDLPA